MKVLDSLFKKEDEEEKAIALGNFDGFHIGHMELVRKCGIISKDENYKSMVLSFKNNPLNFIKKNDLNKSLMTNEDKIELLEDKIDYLLLVDFDNTISHIKAEDFLKLLVDNFNVKAFIIGFNFRFGFKNSGDHHLVSKFCIENKIKFEIVPPVTYNKKVVSSTYIRELLTEQGNIKLVNLLLGRIYSIKGEVSGGFKLGRTIGFPTANLQFDENIAIPLKGVYFTEALVDNKIYRALTNVGYNVTVSNTKKIKIETHLLDFNGDIYEKIIKILFLGRIRDEIKFNNINELKKQIEMDINYMHKTFYN
ncbi:MAG: bifunctional riboflavin kinase/FAD synthetase [Oscillospiraceae bacterium]|nr:bifunctional riboflavin kinase/FAD synthetase [Oscillospiraceae bacterium]